MKKLYEVIVSTFVYAENEKNAISIAISEAKYDERDAYAYSKSFVPDTWWDSIPYGETENRTCREILQEIKERNP